MFTTEEITEVCRLSDAGMRPKEISQKIGHPRVHVCTLVSNLRRKGKLMDNPPPRFSEWPASTWFHDIDQETLDREPAKFGSISSIEIQINRTLAGVPSYGV